MRNHPDILVNRQTVVENVARLNSSFVMLVVVLHNPPDFEGIAGKCNPRHDHKHQAQDQQRAKEDDVDVGAKGAQYLGARRHAQESSIDRSMSARTHNRGGPLAGGGGVVGWLAATHAMLTTLDAALRYLPKFSTSQSLETPHTNSVSRRKLSVTGCV